MSSQTPNYYTILQIPKTATQQQIKQSYKRLALIHHPDKNEGNEQSMIKFRQISEAYTVLNDPKKRENYDKYGVADLEGLNIDQFMTGFQGFEEFLAEFLSFNSFDAMFSSMGGRKSKKATVSRGRVKGRQSNNMSAREMNQLASMMMMGGSTNIGFEMDSDIALIQALLEGGMMDEQSQQMMEKQLEKLILESDDDQDDEDEEDLTEQEMQILNFGNKNISKKKVGKKKKIQVRCLLDGQKIEQDEILMHFSENHKAEFKKWQNSQQTAVPQSPNNEQTIPKNKQEEEIQY